MTYPILRTKRLLLRPWQKEDLEPFAAMNADDRVMEFFPAVKSFEQTRQEYEFILNRFEEHGYCFWAVSELHKTNFIGLIGLSYVDFPAHFTPTVEIGWRLAYDYWGKGYATEGAKASLQYGFETLKLPEIVAFTAKQNRRSQNVMKKIGMHHNSKDDFDHPRLPEDNWLRRHVLYRITEKEWQKLPVD